MNQQSNSPRWVLQLEKFSRRSRRDHALRVALFWAIGLVVVAGLLFAVSFDDIPAGTALAGTHISGLIAGSWFPLLLGCLWAAGLAALFWPMWQRVHAVTLARYRNQPLDNQLKRRSGLGIAHKVLWLTAILLTQTISHFFPDELTPETQAWIEAPAPELPEKGNAYLAVIGLFAPDGEDPESYGREVIAKATDSTIENIDVEASSHAIYKLKNLYCQEYIRLKSGCIDYILSDRAGLKAWTTEHVIALDRIRKIQAMPHYVEVIETILSINTFQYISKVLEINKSLAVLDIFDGHGQLGMPSLLEQIASLKRWLKDPNSVRQKVFFRRHFFSASSLLGEVLVRKPELAVLWKEQIAAALDDTGLDQLNFDAAFDLAHRATIRSLRHDMNKDDSRPFTTLVSYGSGEADIQGKQPLDTALSGMLLRPNDMFNRWHQITKATLNIDFQSSSERAVALAVSNFPTPQGCFDKGLGSLYNLIGCLFLAGNYYVISNDYLLRGPNIQAWARATALQARYLAGDDPDVLLKDQRYAHPETGEWPKLDREKGTVSIGERL